MERSQTIYSPIVELGERYEVKSEAKLEQGVGEG